MYMDVDDADEEQSTGQHETKKGKEKNKLPYHTAPSKQAAIACYNQVRTTKVKAQNHSALTRKRKADEYTPGTCS